MLKKKSNYLFTIGCKFQKEIGNFGPNLANHFSALLQVKKYLTISSIDKDQNKEKSIVNSNGNINQRTFMYSWLSLFAVFLFVVSFSFHQ